MRDVGVLTRAEVGVAQVAHFCCCWGGVGVLSVSCNDPRGIVVVYGKGDCGVWRRT